MTAVGSQPNTGVEWDAPIQAVYDLTQPWSNQTPPWPYFADPEVTSIHRLAKDGKSSQLLKTALHIGTHIDAPIHYSASGWDIAQIPLHRLIGTGVVVDLSAVVGEWGLVTPELVERAASEPLRKGDILILHYGWQRYSYVGAEENEERYFCFHPGTHRAFAEWAAEMDFKWIGVDCPSTDHPLNTSIRDMRPDLERMYQQRMGHPLELDFPRADSQIQHYITLGNNQMIVENIGGDVPQVVGRRLVIGAFPWRFVRGEAAFCRVLAFEFEPASGA